MCVYRLMSNERYHDHQRKKDAVGSYKHWCSACLCCTCLPPLLYPFVLWPNMTTGAGDIIPFVHYYCACPDLTTAQPADPQRSPDVGLKKEAVDDAKSIGPSSASTSTSSNHPKEHNIDASTTGYHLLSRKASNYLYPLSRLYFCEDCHQIRCPSCVQDEIMSYYCPNCLFEVKSISHHMWYSYLYIKRCLQQVSRVKRTGKKW